MADTTYTCWVFFYPSFLFRAFLGFWGLWYSDATITCDQGAVEIEDFGFRLRRRPVVPHPRYPNHRHLGGGVGTPTGLDQAMAHAVENLHAAVKRGARLMSDGRNAMAAQAVCDAIRRDADRQEKTER